MWWDSAEDLIINLMFTIFYIWVVFYLLQYLNFIIQNFSILHERIILFP